MDIDEHVKCPNCGKIVPKGKFCIYCGYSLENAAKVTLIEKKEEKIEEVGETVDLKNIMERINKIESMLEKAVFCPNCGALIIPKNNKCGVCGAEIK